MSALPLPEANMRAVVLFWWKYFNYISIHAQYHIIILISKYTINHIKSGNIIKWLTVIQSDKKKEKEKESRNEKEKDWKKESKKERKKEMNKKRVGEKVKTPEERRTEEIKELKKYRNEEK